MNQLFKKEKEQCPPKQKWQLDIWKKNYLDMISKWPLIDCCGIIQVFHDKPLWQICQIWQKLNESLKNYHTLGLKVMLFSISSTC